MFVEPRKAGSIILIRNKQVEQGERAEAKETWEVLMGLRNERSAFVPGAYVFPGGALAQDDVALARFQLARLHPKSSDTALAQSIFQHNAQPVAETAARAATQLATARHRARLERQPEAEGDADKFVAELAIKLAAIRECFEEMGVILAYQDDGTPVSLAEQERLEGLYRPRALSGDAGAFTRMLMSAGLKPMTDSLHFFSRWITPPFFPIRYDASFFVALMPTEQKTRPDGRELVERIWLSPAEILARNYRGDLPLVYPTLMSIRELAEHKESAELFAKLS